MVLHGVLRIWNKSFLILTTVRIVEPVGSAKPKMKMNVKICSAFSAKNAEDWTRERYKIDEKGEDRRQKRSGMMQDKATEGGDEEMSVVEEKEEYNRFRTMNRGRK